jgi:RimJ/RimL family protein N-acetyltransferase
MILRSERLQLRYFDRDDAPRVTELASVFEIADTTLSIPHPYELNMALDWIQTHKQKRDKNEEYVFAITLRNSSQLIGAIGITLFSAYNRGEMGYWIGKPYWNRGFATEAGKALLRFGFEDLRLNRIFARRFSRNPASGRVLLKIGMAREGCMRQHIKRWDKYEDIEFYAILYKDYAAGSQGTLV